MSHYRLLSGLTTDKSGESVPSLRFRKSGTNPRGADVYAWTVSSDECKYSRLVWEVLMWGNHDGSPAWTQMSCHVQDDGKFWIERLVQGGALSTMGADMSEEQMIHLFDTFVDALSISYRTNPFMPVIYN